MSTLEPGSVRGSVNILANDEDPDGTLLEVEQLGSPSKGIIESIENGVVTYLYTGSGTSDGFDDFDNFIYTVRDSDGGESAFASVFIRISAP